MHAATSAKVQEARLSALQAEVDNLQQELGEHEDAEKIVKQHIKLLHRYNEAKDATQASIEIPHTSSSNREQILIGRLATLKETTVRQIHEDLGLDGGD